MIYSLGIDPDLHCTALAVTSPDRVVAVKAIRVPNSIKGQDAVEAMVKGMLDIPGWLDRLGAQLSHVTAEGQQIYAKHTKNWDSILALAPVAGAAAAIALSHSSGARLRIPKPQEWKGSIPKGVHQRRTLRRRGIAFLPHGTLPEVDPASVAEIDGAAELRLSAWSHVIDAIGLADWGVGRG